MYRPPSSPLRAALGILALTLLACAKPPAPTPAQRAFYWWRTTLDPTPAERAALEQLHVNRLYLRYFDIDLSPGASTPQTLGKLTTRGAELGSLEVIPVVFLREKVFHSVHADRTADLASHVWRQVQELSARLRVTPREVQFDCDWTDSTRDGYFAFLKAASELAAKDRVALSSTIRLHQVKFRERTGVPPVQRGMLMYYNMGRIGAEPTDRAIFDASAASRYLARLPEYPLPLDVALPIWAWTVQVRDGKVQGLLQSTDPAGLATLDFLQALGPQRWTVTRPTFVDGTFVRAGDILQGESIDPTAALTAAQQLAAALPPQAGRTTSLFDLSERNLTRHDHASLERLFNVIR